MGYGFVQYSNEAPALTALNESNLTLDDKKLIVCKYTKNKAKILIGFNNVYVNNIPIDYDNEIVKTKFEEFGKISSHIIKLNNIELYKYRNFSQAMKDLIMKFKYGFFCYEKFDSAQKVCSEVPYMKLDDEIYNKNLKEKCLLVEDLLKDIPKK